MYCILQIAGEMYIPNVFGLRQLISRLISRQAAGDRLRGPGSSPWLLARRPRSGVAMLWHARIVIAPLLWWPGGTHAGRACLAELLASRRHLAWAALLICLPSP